MSYDEQRDWQRQAEAVQYNEWQAERDVDDARNEARHLRKRAEHAKAEYRNIMDELEAENTELGEQVKELRGCLKLAHSVLIQFKAYQQGALCPRIVKAIGETKTA